MAFRGLTLSLALIAGCTEYTLGDGSDVYGQPNPPFLGSPVKTDRVVQVTVPSVDVLWVVDNSCSMYDEQTALQTNFPKFMNYFVGSGLDYHVGMVSTDMDSFSHSGKLQPDPWSGVKIIDPSVADPVPVFQRMANLGTNGSATEKGRAAAWSALVTRAATDNAGFYRDDAFLSIIVISDEDDYSGNIPVGLPDFISWLRGLKDSPDMVTFSSIVGPPGGCSSAYEAGAQYMAVTDALGGIKWSICDPNWDTILDALGMQAAGLRREFFLTEVPVADTIEVWVDDQGVSTSFIAGLDYTYNRPRNSVTFSSFVPQPFAQVFIRYEVLAGQQTEETDTALP